MQHVLSCTQHNHISSREHAWLKIKIAHHCVLTIIVIHVSCLTCLFLLPLLSFHSLVRHPILLEHDEHLGPDERAHCDDLRQSGGFIDNDTHILDCDSCTRKSIAEAHITSGKPSTTRSIDKVCTDAGFLKTVEVGQYFMTRHTDEFLHFAEPVTCREYNLPRDDKSTDPKGWKSELNL